MGCGGSKEKKPVVSVVKPVEKVDEKPAPKVETPLLVSPTVKEEKKEESPSELSMISTIYKYNLCSVDGEVTPLFPPNGLCYHIVQDDKWFFYNDTMNYEFHLNYRFPPYTDVTAAARATKKILKTKWISISAVVYPLETIEFAYGQMGPHLSNVYANPLSNEFYERLNVLSKDAESELQNVLSLADGSVDEEEVLRRCVETHTPFVDPVFLPSQAMLSRHRIDGREIKPKELRRPKEISGFKPEKANAVLGKISPLLIDGGLLADKWFLSAMAILAEGGTRVKKMFADNKPEETSLGAHRVLFNKNGWWKYVLLDDFLPTVNGVPCFARVKHNPSVLWASLLQKAYAKLHGSYASITGGDTLHALRDFSGAPTCRFDDAWAKAAVNPTAANELLDKLVGFINSGDVVVLTTPMKKVIDSEKPASGLRDGYTYYVETVRRFPEHNLTLLKIHNPWEPAKPWTGAWAANCPKWSEYEKVKEECDPDFFATDGSFWMEWADAAKHFDGCGVVYKVQTPTCDYRVLGEFEYTCPNVVFVVRAAAPVEVMLVLTQRDKRGLCVDSPNARLSPLMLSVSHAVDNSQRVVKSSTLEPEGSTDTHTFVVAREVFLVYKFEPSDKPYFVIPRIHRKGISEGQKKEFVLGIRSLTPLDGVLDVCFTKLDASLPVFKNRVQFTVERTPEVVCPLQKRLFEDELVTTVGSRLSTAAAALPPRPVAERLESSEYEPERPQEKKENEAPLITCVAPAPGENAEILLNLPDKDLKELSHGDVAALEKQIEAPKDQIVPESNILKE